MAAVGGSAASRQRARWRMRRRQPRLRIGLFADDPMQPRWMVEAFARIARSDFADVVLIAARRSGKPPKPWLWRACTRLDRALFARGDDPSEPALLRAAMPLARHEKCRDAPGEMLAAWRRSGLTDMPLDVVFALGDVDVHELESVARYGVWRWCFGAAHDGHEDLAGWREVAHGEPITESGLRVSMRGRPDRLLHQSRSRTYQFSVAKNRANLFRKTALFAERELRLLHRLGELHMARSGTPLFAAASRGAEPAPRSAEILRGFFGVGGRILKRGLQKMTCIDQWFLAYRFGLPACDGDLSRYVRLLPPKDRIWADPFPLERHGRHFIFFEEVPFATGKGHIAVIEIGEDGRRSEPVTVLQRSFHLSYPFLIEHEGTLFMVPESGQNRSVDLYRCMRFPDVWRFEKTLLRDLPCADATFHRSGERWWMFVNSGAEGTELYDELHLFYADDLLGEWHAHPANPVKSDVYGARPAGALYLRDGVLHRPAQICAPLYGSGLSIARVHELTPSSYVETEVARILPPQDQGVLGIHTFNRSGRLGVIDGFARRSRWP
ncbi:MAG TPA: hypothetical protein VF801_17335 [Rhodocyclaceae bacterium]